MRDMNNPLAEASGFGVAEEERYSFSPSDVIFVDRDMTIPEVIESLSKHDCVDVTSVLDLEKCDQFPTEIHASSRLYRGVTYDGVEIALQCIDPGLTVNTHQAIVESAVSELSIWSKCYHPNVDQLLGIAHYDAQLAIISPWMGEINLNEHLSVQRPPWLKKLNLGIQIAEGLAYLHTMGMVHGDLKGDNIFVPENGTPVITGFGTSILRRDSLQFIRLNDLADLSMRWAAPELFTDRVTATRMADVWALGMVALEIFTGSVPYVGIDEIVVWEEIIKPATPERPEEHIPTGDTHADLLWLLLNQCWAADPENRPTAAEVRDKLGELASMHSLER